MATTSGFEAPSQPVCAPAVSNNEFAFLCSRVLGGGLPARWLAAASSPVRCGYLLQPVCDVVCWDIYPAAILTRSCGLLQRLWPCLRYALLALHPVKAVLAALPQALRQRLALQQRSIPGSIWMPAVVLPTICTISPLNLRCSVQQYFLSAAQPKSARAMQTQRCMCNRTSSSSSRSTLHRIHSSH